MGPPQAPPLCCQPVGPGFTGQVQRARGQRYPWKACLGTCGFHGGGCPGVQNVRQWWTPRLGRWMSYPRESAARMRRPGRSCTRPRGCRCAGRPSRRGTAWSPPPGGSWSPGSRSSCTAWPVPPWSTCRRTTLRTSPLARTARLLVSRGSGDSGWLPERTELLVLARTALWVAENPSLPQPGPALSQTSSSNLPTVADLSSGNLPWAVQPGPDPSSCLFCLGSQLAVAWVSGGWTLPAALP